MNKTSALIIGFIVAGFLYLNQYETVGFLIAGFSIIAFITTALTEKPSKKSTAQGYSLGDPIFIESTRKAPYRIPEKMEITYKGNAGQRKPWWKKVTDKGILGYVGKKTGKTLKKMRED